MGIPPCLPTIWRSWAAGWMGQGLKNCVLLQPPPPFNLCFRTATNGDCTMVSVCTGTGEGLYCTVYSWAHIVATIWHCLKANKLSPIVLPLSMGSKLHFDSKGRTFFIFLSQCITEALIRYRNKKFCKPALVFSYISAITNLDIFTMNTVNFSYISAIIL